jgi:ankyrin repeat protein
MAERKVGMYGLPTFQRTKSSYNVEQHLGTCFAHSSARLLARLIKLIVPEFFPVENERCDYYYNDLNCNFDERTIFDCFNEIKGDEGNTQQCKNLILDKSNRHLKENISALLYYYIYNYITSKFGCAGGFSIITNFYFLYDLKKSGVTIESIKFLLKYNSSRYTDHQKTYFELKILELFNVLNKFKEYATSNELILFVYPKYSFNSYDEILFQNFINLLKFILSKGFYASFEGSFSDNVAHSVLISAIENNYLIIKNTWGIGNKTQFPEIGLKDEKIDLTSLTTAKIKRNKLNFCFFAPSVLLKTDPNLLKQNKPFMFTLDDAIIWIASKTTPLPNANEILSNLLSDPSSNINVKDAEGITPLMLAAINGNPDLIKILLEFRPQGSQERINVNIQNNDGDTALILAAAEENEEVVQRLLEFQPYEPQQQQLDINIQNYEGLTALANAVNLGDLEIVQRLLEFKPRGSQKKININIRDNEDDSAIRVAIKKSKVEMVKAILRFYGNDISSEDIGWINAFLFKIIDGRKRGSELFDILLKIPGIDVNIRDKNGNTLLIYAIKNELVEIPKILLRDTKIYINAENNEGDTALTLAKKMNQSEIIKLLQNANAVDSRVGPTIFSTSLDLSSMKEKEPPFILERLVEICRSGNEAGLDKVLAEAGPAVVNDSLDSQGRTCLMSAVEQNNAKFVGKLLSIKDINVNARNNKGQTALIIATIRENTELVKAFLRISSIDISIKDEKGLSAIDHARKTGHKSIISLLSDDDSDDDSDSVASSAKSSGGGGKHQKKTKKHFLKRKKAKTCRSKRKVKNKQFSRKRKPKQNKTKQNKNKI